MVIAVVAFAKLENKEVKLQQAAEYQGATCAACYGIAGLRRELSQKSRFPQERGNFRRLSPEHIVGQVAKQGCRSVGTLARYGRSPAHHLLLARPKVWSSPAYSAWR